MPLSSFLWPYSPPKTAFWKPMYQANGRAGRAAGAGICHHRQDGVTRQGAFVSIRAEPHRGVMPSPPYMRPIVFKGGMAMDHPNARTCWTKVRIDLSALETVYMIETDLALLPDDRAYDHEAFSGFVEAIRGYLADHPNYDRAEVVPLRDWQNLVP